MRTQFELLAPGGDIDSIKAAIVAGADAIYCGLDSFNARQRATNISFDELNGILRLAHENSCSVFLTLNILLLEREIPALIKLLNKVVNTSIDGVIVQDLGMFYLISNYFKSLKIHASTQVTTHNEGQITFLDKLSVNRVNLSRELSINEIKALTLFSHDRDILTEVFVHGSYCIGFSGLCYMSSAQNGNSGNRGRCSQPCRDQYSTTSAGKKFPLNLKDNSAFFDLKELSNAGVDSLKIEGRIKKFHYVYTVVKSWKNQIQSFYKSGSPDNDDINLYKVFNRDFTDGYLRGDLSKNMFIDNPRDNSIQLLSEKEKGLTQKERENIKQAFYDEKREIISHAKDKIKDITIEKTPLSIKISGDAGGPLNISIDTPDTSFSVISKSCLTQESQSILTESGIKKRFKGLNRSETYIKNLELKDLKKGLFIPFQELTEIKNKILSFIIGDKKEIAPIDIPPFKKSNRVISHSTLLVLISSKEDLSLCSETSASIYYQIPDCLHNECSTLVELFKEHPTLIPWFPSILIGENFIAAIDFLKQVCPKRIITNNTGIAYEAGKAGIEWIAGPQLNITNSFALLCLKEKLKCSGAFISNELNKNQIKKISCPDDFDLYHSIYHPILLLTSRQCLFYQTSGCKKDQLDSTCLQSCKKSTSITKLKQTPILIDKQKENYNSVYSDIHFFNADILTDLPNLFSGYCIDLRDIITQTKMKQSKTEMVHLFEDLLNDPLHSIASLRQNISPSTDTQYQKGLI